MQSFLPNEIAIDGCFVHFSLAKFREEPLERRRPRLVQRKLVAVERRISDVLELQ
jgi:hypothetical protein